MCGIAGYIGSQELPPARLERCLDLMARRGPDARGTYHHVGSGGRQVYLLHTRLSIIDIGERANQPFRAGAAVIAFNGEIYNYVELRDGPLRGEPFRTRSDTEVLLAALRREGPAALDRCEGMWALAVFDEEREELVLSRDRFGEKPLYLHRDATGLYFGSEPKLIFALLGRRLAVDREHLRRYLARGYRAIYGRSSATFFAGLEELRPGHSLVVDHASRERLERYWSPSLEPADDMTYEEAVAGAREALLRSLEVRLRADVPLAFCLSGGVDSNSLVAIAKRVFGYDVHAFTVVDDDERYDERPLVAHSVGALALRHTPLPTDTGEFIPRLGELVRYHDAPVYTITYFAQWRLMGRVADHGYRISISGVGADELFSGYFDHHLAYLYDVRTDAARHAQALSDWQTHVAPAVRNPYLRDPQLFVRDPSFRDHLWMDEAACAGYLVEPWAEPFHEERYSSGLLRNRMLNELFHETVRPVLHEEDLNAMYFSIENRSPFLDRGLFAHCVRIPARLLVRAGAAKAVLREAMRGLVPDPILDNRRKIGFNAPIGSYLSVADPRVRARLLEEGPIFELVRRDAIASLLERSSLQNSESKFLFSFLSTKLFLEEFA